MRCSKTNKNLHDTRYLEIARRSDETTSGTHHEEAARSAPKGIDLTIKKDSLGLFETNRHYRIAPLAVIVHLGLPRSPTTVQHCDIIEHVRQLMTIGSRSGQHLH